MVVWGAKSEIRRLLGGEGAPVAMCDDAINSPEQVAKEFSVLLIYMNFLVVIGC